MFMQKFKCSFTSHRMSSIKKFYFCFISKIKLVIKEIYLSVLIRNPLIRLNQIMMTAFNHKRPWKDKVCYLGVTECASHVEIRHLPFQAIHKAAFEMRIGNL